MPTTTSPVDPARARLAFRLSQLPWVTRVAALIVVPLLIAWHTIEDRGLEDGDPLFDPDLFAVSPNLAATVWVLMAPCVLAEIEAVKRGLRLLAHALAVVAVVPVALGGTISIWFTFDGSEPVDPDWMLYSLGSCVFYALVYLATTVGILWKDERRASR